MRPDLSLQGLDFTFALLLLNLEAVFHQLLDPVGHRIELVAEFGDFVIDPDVCLGVKIPLLKLLHGIFQGEDRIRQALGGPERNEQAHQGEKEADPDIGGHQSRTDGHQLAGIKNTDDGPVSGQNLDTGIDFPLDNRRLDGFPGDGQVQPFRLDIAVNQPLLRMVDQLAVGTDDEHIASLASRDGAADIRDGLVVQVDQQNALQLAVFIDALAERNHPAMFTCNEVFNPG